MSGRIANMGRTAYHIIDAKGQVVGRLASQLAPILRGKHKPTYMPNVDCGDVVVVVNAEHIVLTGNKWDNKLYRWHTGYPGGLKERTANQMKERNSSEILRKAVLGMLPKNKMRAVQMSKLKIFPGEEHNFHEELGPKPKFL
jgi:large subunit ribosomal protein L13